MYIITRRPFACFHIPLGIVNTQDLAELIAMDNSKHNKKDDVFIYYISPTHHKGLVYKFKAGKREWTASM